MRGFLAANTTERPSNLARLLKRSRTRVPRRSCLPERRRWRSEVVKRTNALRTRVPRGSTLTRTKLTSERVCGIRAANDSCR
jgi:hypothetical protein